MIDTDMAEQILQGDDTHPDILQALGLEILAEVKRLQERVKDLEYEVENWKGELSVRMHPIDYDALVNGGEEE